MKTIKEISFFLILATWLSLISHKSNGIKNKQAQWKKNQAFKLVSKHKIPMIKKRRIGYTSIPTNENYIAFTSRRYSEEKFIERPKVFNIQKKKKVFTSRYSPIIALSLNADGTLLAYSDIFRAIIIKKLDKKKKKWKTQKILKNFGDGLISDRLTLSGNGSHLACFNAETNETYVYDFERNQDPIFWRNNFSLNATHPMVLSYDGNYIAFGSLNGTVSVFHTNGEKKCEYKDKNGLTIWAVTLSKDNKYVASGNQYGEVTVFDIRNKKEVLKRDSSWCKKRHKDGFSLNVTGISLSQDNRYVALCIKPCYVVVYDIQKKKPVFKCDHGRSLTLDVCFKKNRNLIAVSHKGIIKEYENLTNRDKRERLEFLQAKTNILVIMNLLSENKSKEKPFEDEEEKNHDENN